MLSDAVIVGFMTLLCAILQGCVSYFKSDLGLLWIKLFVFFGVGGLTVLNGVLFGNVTLSRTVVMGYLASGLTTGGIATGLYAIGENAINANKPEAKKARLEKRIAKAQLKLNKVNARIAKEAIK